MVSAGGEGGVNIVEVYLSLSPPGYRKEGFPGKRDVVNVSSPMFNVHTHEVYPTGDTVEEGFSVRKEREEFFQKVREQTEFPGKKRVRVTQGVLEISYQTHFYYMVSYKTWW